MEMVYSYLNSMQDDGYIPAEQIRGAEAEELAKCPCRISQRNTTAHAPSLVLVLSEIKQAATYNGWDSREHDFLNVVVEKLGVHFDWFIKTQ